MPSKRRDFILRKPSPERPARTYTLTEDFSFRRPRIPQWLVNEILLDCQRRSPQPRPPPSRLLSCVILEIRERYPDPACRPSVNEFLFQVLEDYARDLHEQHRDTLRAGRDGPALF